MRLYYKNICIFVANIHGIEVFFANKILLHLFLNS